MKISDGYRKVGVGAFYENHSHEYSNPHSVFVENCLNHCTFRKDERVLDMGCGDGLVTKYLLRKGLRSVTGADGYMSKRYQQETGMSCHEVSFEDIATRGMPNSEVFDTVICSYIVDIIPESFRHNFFWNIALRTKRLIVIRPNSHKLNYGFLELELAASEEKSKITSYRIVL